MATGTPESITGGCLCGAIRYTITFPPNHSFETECSTCQCSQCRKNSGSLLARLHGVPSSALTYTSPTTTLKTYHATPPCARGFCGDCGSFLFWRDERSPEQRVSVAVGTFDKEVLKRWGPVVAGARTHLWCEDEIPGVTDHLEGEKWKLDCDGEGAERMD
ncbi:Mss4-like protein [Thelonectria olida]|uniref:Mss4-like protein n=1 Tax=Thelonectria olida TaxID=1576542 RepID=A0A9P8W260_9HYPO|nr:Mss4-like protein [Thelonectria olida]